MAARSIGDRGVFAIEVLDRRPVDGTDFRPVDIWIDGRSVCVNDNVVLVASFVLYVSHDLRDLRKGRELSPPPGTRTPLEAHRWCCDHAPSGEHERYWFMQWSETTDSVSTYLFQFDDRLVVTAQYCRDVPESDHQRVLVASMPQAVLEGLLAEAIDALQL